MSYGFIFFGIVTGYAQKPIQWSANEIYHALEKFNTFGSVLYVGAHPDDENTRLITYFANEELAQTAYLSLTRGGGGQNLIGPELKTTLGIIRSHELLQARNIDGGTQFFTRAIDFGYCKHPSEAMETWGKDEILRDVVRIFRKFKPDLVVNRFNHRTPGTTHGHHTASALLSIEAFDKANDPNYDPESVQQFGLWQPKRLFFNTSWWFYGSQEAFDAADKTNLVEFPVGQYYAPLGRSNGELAAQSRSMHKSQGFGSLSTREQETEYLELILGTMPKNKSDLFDGIQRGWSQLGLNNDDEIISNLDHVIQNFDFKNPQKHALTLLKVLDKLQALPEHPLKNNKIQTLTQIIVQCLGLYVSAESSVPFITPKDPVLANVEVTNRSANTLLLHRVSSDQLYFFDNTQPVVIDPLQSLNIESLEAPLKSVDLSTPYWLKHTADSGKFNVPDTDLIGTPFGPEPVNVRLDFSLDGHPFTLNTPLRYKYRDRVRGEVFDPFVILPKITLSTSEPVMVFNDQKSKTLDITLRTHSDGLKGSLSLQHPEGWVVKPEFIDFDIAKAGQQIDLSFSIFPPKGTQTGQLMPLAQVGDEFYTKTLLEIDYPHIPKVTVLAPAQTKVMKLDVLRKTKHIGYIQGAGDQVDKGLSQLGYEVVNLNPETLNSEELSLLEAVVVGIRAFNTSEALVARMEMLNDYVAQGGLLLIQYQTTSGLLTKQIGPLSFAIGRDRVTDQEAPMTFLNPEHAVFNTPNLLTSEDFEHWVQERGLYFAASWSPEFTPLIGMNDTGEEQTKGGLILGHFGKGTVIYTGISFFRQIPEGVPGAYKLLANLLSYSHE
jgi:LmbE family N-acetylglucosaminyl deacetylase